MTGRRGAVGAPPPLLRRMLGSMVPGLDRAHLLEEMDALYARRRGRDGRLRAQAWYLRALLGFLVRVPFERLLDALRSLAADQKLIVRGLRSRRGYAVAMVLTLSVGLGCLTAVYAIADWVLLRPVPGVADPAGIVVLRLGSSESERPSWWVSHPDLLRLREGIDGLHALEASRPIEANVTSDQGLSPARIGGAVVTGGWFDALGVAFAAGHGLSAESRPELSGVGQVVIAHDLAEALAGEPAAVLGRPIRINGAQLRVVGVTEPGFRGHHFPGLERFWLGAASLTAVDGSVTAGVFEQPRASLWAHMVGRLHGGVAADAIEAQANAVLERVQNDRQPSTFAGVTHFVFQVTPRLGLDRGLQGDVGRTLLLLAVTAAFLLLLAVTNATNLGLTHAASRAPLYAVQRALGIGRARLVRQLAGEYVLLGVLAAIVTLALVVAAAHVLRDLQLDEFGGSLTGLAVTPRVIAAAGLLALACALLAGLAPGALVLRQGLVDSLRGGGSRAAYRLRDLLVVGQVAVGTTLLVGAGLMARTVIELESTELGFDPAGIVSFAVDPHGDAGSGAELRHLLQRLETAIEQIPGLRVGFVYPQPLSTSYLTSFLSPSGDPEDADRLIGAHMQVSGDFLAALGARVIGGPTDLGAFGRRGPQDPAGVVISRSAAAALAPDTPPAQVPGTVLWTWGPERTLVPVSVVAVIDDVKLRGAALDAAPLFVWPWGQSRFDGAATGWVRVRGLELERLLPRLRAAVAAVDPALPLFAVETVEARLATISSTRRVVAGLAATLSGLGVLLAAIGLYGVLGYAVTERRREIGIRAALGASPAELCRRVLLGGVGRVALGLVPGLLGAVAAARALESLLYGIDPIDSAAFGASIALLLVVGLLAAWLPSRWAAAVSPTEVLRSDA